MRRSSIILAMKVGASARTTDSTLSASAAAAASPSSSTCGSCPFPVYTHTLTHDHFGIGKREVVMSADIAFLVRSFAPLTSFTSSECHRQCASTSPSMPGLCPSAITNPPSAQSPLLEQLLNAITDNNSDSAQSDEAACSCLALYAPVCEFTTGRTYSNECSARCAGVNMSLVRNGEC